MTNPGSNYQWQHLEEIVAYLDGELTEVESAQVEERLSVDQSYRRQMQDIDRAWNALDELPEVTASDAFSKTTMEVLVGTARQEVQDCTMALPRLRRKRSMVGGALIATAVAFGFLGFQLVRTNPNATLVADLPVIVHVDIYSQFEEIQFLRDLRQAIEGTSWKGLEPSDELAHLKEQFQTVALEESRREWLRCQTDEEKTALRSKYNRCTSLTPKRQGALRKLHKDLVTAKDSDQLLDTMLLYQRWLEYLPPSRKYQLRDLPREHRVHEIIREVQQRGDGIPMELTADQYVEISKKIRARMPEVRTRIYNEISPKEKKRLDGMEERERQAYLLRMVHKQPLGLRDELRKIVGETLTVPQQSQFKQLPYPQQGAMLRGWLQSAWSHGEVTQKELEEFFANELDPAEREKLLVMPRDQMQRRLSQLYLGVEGRHWSDARPARGRPGISPGPPHGRPPHRPGFEGRHPAGWLRGKSPVHDGSRRDGHGPRRGDPMRGNSSRENF